MEEEITVEKLFKKYLIYQIHNLSKKKQNKKAQEEGK